MLVRALNLPPSSDYADQIKKDVTVSGWAVEDVAAAASGGVITGDGEQLGGHLYATREQAFVMLFRAFKLGGTEKSYDFADGDKISVWAKPALNTMAGGGYVVGDADGNALPLNEITRAEFCAVLLRMIR